MPIRPIATLAAMALLSMGGTAMAQTAVAVDNANVRAGPGAQYEVIDQLPAGERVSVLDCQGPWCEIGMGRGESGFVYRSLLDDGDGPRRSRRIVAEPQEGVAIYDDEPDAVAGLSIGGYYESRPFYVREGYYYWGGRWYQRRPGAPGWRERSWRRWGDRRGGGDARGGERTNRPPRAEGPRYANRPPREERPGGERDRPSRAEVDRGGRGDGAGRGGDRPARDEARSSGRGGGGDAVGGAREPAPSTTPRDSGGGSRTPADRGDRIGLDRAGGGGRD